MTIDNLFLYFIRNISNYEIVIKYVIISNKELDYLSEEEFNKYFSKNNEKLLFKNNKDILLAYSINMDDFNKSFVNLDNIYYCKDFENNYRRNLEEYIRQNKKINVIEIIGNEEIYNGKKYYKNFNNISLFEMFELINTNNKNLNNKIKYTQNILYDNNAEVATGKELQLGIFMILVLFNKDEVKYLLNNEKSIVKFRIPNTDKTQHYFAKIVDKLSKTISQYDSNYKYLGDKDTLQLLTTSLQGKSSCFYFYFFFMKKVINFLQTKQKDFDEIYKTLQNDNNKIKTLLKIRKDPYQIMFNSLIKETITEKFKEPFINLEIIKEVLNFIIPDQKYFLIKKQNEINNIDNKDKYYFVSEEPINKDKEQKIICIYREDLSKISFNTKDNITIVLNEIINHKNILQYCLNNDFIFYSKQNKDFIQENKEQLKSNIENMIDIKLPSNMLKDSSKSSGSIMNINTSDENSLFNSRHNSKESSANLNSASEELGNFITKQDKNLLEK